MSSLKTFVDLYEFLKKENDISEWLNNKWEGKDKQESLLRLFAGLGLIEKLNSFKICKGNFNTMTIEPFNSLSDIFYSNSDEINLKDKGDSSDLTGLHKENKKCILATTSKNINKENIGKLDIDKILTNFKKYEKENYTLVLCVCIRNINDFNVMTKRIESTNQDLIELLNSNSTIVIDHSDLIISFKKFKKIFQNVSLNSLLGISKLPLVFKMHQEISIYKTKTLLEKGEEFIQWGQIQRSGKSYIIAGTIIENSKNKDNCNYLFLTTAPRETISQQEKVLNCLQLKDFKIFSIDGKSNKPNLSKKNIILVSIHYLKCKTEENQNEILKNTKFDLAFLDESHNGGTTDLTKETLEIYVKQSPIVFITATYAKSVFGYKIPNQNLIRWDLEDINFCKKLNIDEKRENLIEKQSKYFEKEKIISIVNSFEIENLMKTYEKYPELCTLTHKITEDIISEINKTDSIYGYSINSAFLLTQNKNNFQNENEPLKIFRNIFEENNGIYPNENSFRRRINKIRKELNTRNPFGTNDNPCVIMIFLPERDISNISNATEELLIREKIIPEYNIIKLNSKETSDSKKTLDDAIVKSKNMNKKGVVVLSGTQCSLGVSIDCCDLVILLNEGHSYDRIYQMMFRSMTESENKKIGFVIDYNFKRLINDIIFKYANTIKPELHPKDSIKYLLEEKLLNFNPDHWMPLFGNNRNNYKILIENMYKIHTLKSDETLQRNLDRLKSKDIELSDEDQNYLNNHWKFSKQKKNSEIIAEVENENLEQQELKPGVEKIEVEDENSREENEKVIAENENIKFMEIFSNMIVLLSVLSIEKNEISTFEEMFDFVYNNKFLSDLLCEQLKISWGNSVDKNIIKTIYNIYYHTEMRNDMETNQIIRTVKEVFVKNKDNPEELSKCLDKYLVPQDLEKKNNAEVSTPYELRKKMLDKIPNKFWETPRRIFEPCSGKGGFLVDILYKFKKHLKFKDYQGEELHKFIVEQCIYFADINPFNIFICRILLDPENQYNLNCYHTDTLKLKLDIQFDAVIGNPPYNSPGSTATGNTIWQHFVRKALNEWILNKGFLVFVHPPGWRKPDGNKNKHNGLFELMTKDNQMKYLSIHNTKDGMKIFKCGTRYDWYVIQKMKSNKETTVEDENRCKLNLNLKPWEFLPNSNIQKIKELLKNEDQEGCEIIYNASNYDPRKKWISKTKTEEFKYPIIHTIPKTGIRYVYSNTNEKGHFGIPKVIFADNGLNDAVIDIEGNYGMTQHSMAIKIDSIEEGTLIKKAILSDEFKEIIKNCTFGNYQIEWLLFTYFHKDFWKSFV